MLSKIKTKWNTLRFVGVALGIIMTASVDHEAWGEDNLPVGRTATVIVDGQHPASYFSNTELVGADEMRVTARMVSGKVIPRHRCRRRSTCTFQMSY